MSGLRKRGRKGGRDSGQSPFSERVYRTLLSAAYSRREREVLDLAMDDYRDRREDARAEGWPSLVGLWIEVLWDLAEISVQNSISGHGVRRLSKWEVLLVCFCCYFAVYGAMILATGLLSLSVPFFYIYNWLSQGGLIPSLPEVAALTLSFLCGGICLAVARMLWALSLEIRSELRAARSC